MGFINASINTAKCPRTTFSNILFSFIMDTSINLMIDNDKVDLLQNFKPHIESLFKVLITLGKEGPGTRWIHVSTPTGNTNTVQAAKEYVCSLCIPESERHQQTNKYSGEIYQKLLQVRDQIERESGAIVCFEGDLTVIVSGRDANVSSACSLFEQTLKELDEQPFVKGGLLEQKKLAELKAKLESEDSSYDSEGCEEVESQHEEVHRTVSDTLQAEYADFVDSRQQKIECSPGFLAGCPQEDDDKEEDDPLDDPYFTSKAEFGLKLGYTEKQVLQALKKLGPSPDENELLGELIRVGANTKGVSLGLDSSPDFKDDNLRHIVIDGSNVAKSHGNKEVFSCRGIQLAVDWFRKRGHREITVFVPQWRKEASRPDAPITDQEVLLQLEKEQILVFTPSRRIGGKRTVCYDDRYIIKLAAEVDGIVVSNDNYRDLLESPEFKKIIEERVLMYSFVNDRFMPPDDPLGRHGPSLDNFLLKEPIQTDPLARPCPYSKKCTYGNKCKFYHPERGNQPQKSVTEALMENAKEKIRNLRRDSSPAGEILKTKLAPTQSADAVTELLAVKKQPLNRTKSLVTGQLPSKQMKSPGKEVSDTCNQVSSVSGVSAKIAGLNVGDRDLTRITTPSLNLAGGTPSLNPTGASWSQNFRRSSIPGGDSAISGWNPLIVGSETLPSRNTVQSLGFISDHGGHLALAKRLSDPDNHKPIDVTVAPPPEHAPPNTHQKLKRLLSLNPNDTRVQQPWRMASYPPTMAQPEQSPPEAMTPGHRRHLCRQSSYNDNHGYTMRTNIAGDDVVHPSLTRISSAPDAQRNSNRRAQGHMRRQNSSSDPQLNIHQEFLPELLTPTADVFSYSEVDQNPWGPPHLIRQHGFQRNVPPVSQPPAWLSSTGLSRQSNPMDAFYLPQPMHPPPPGAIGQRSSPVPSGNNSAVEDPRFKLYYHLSSVFPEEQVRVVMNRHPDETNPQKICSVILEMYSRSYLH